MHPCHYSNTPPIRLFSYRFCTPWVYPYRSPHPPYPALSTLTGMLFFVANVEVLFPIEYLNFPLGLTLASYYPHKQFDAVFQIEKTEFVKFRCGSGSLCCYTVDMSCFQYCRPIDSCLVAPSALYGIVGSQSRFPIDITKEPLE